MALLEELIITGGGEDMLGAGNAFDKLNEAIRKFNDTFGGGSAGQILRKVDSTDFNFAITTPRTGIDKDSSLNWTTIDIGTWNMDSSSSVTVAIPVGLSFAKIRTIDVMIVSDDGLGKYPLSRIGVSGTTIEGGVDSITASLIAIGRRATGYFDGIGFSGGSNRGWITIGYID